MIHKSLFAIALLACIGLLAACSPKQASPAPAAGLANPASVFCEQQSGKLQIVTAADGSQSGVCVFPDGSSCDEWAYYRGECQPGGQTNLPAPATEIATTQSSGSGTAPGLPTALPINPADYSDWWTYTQPVYQFTIMLPQDWVVEEVTTGEPLMDGHLLNLHPDAGGDQNIRLTFRKTGEDTQLWPSGVGQGEFVPQGTLDIAAQPAQRFLLVCPGGEVSSIWYHQGQNTPNITRGNMEFGFIFNASSQHCQTGATLNGKTELTGEMIIASLKLP